MPFCCSRQRKHLLTRGTVVLACLSASTEIASAQSVAFDPLAVPSAVIFCRAVPVARADSAAFQFEFVDGGDSARSRRSFVAFDSAGRALYMWVVAPRKKTSGELQTYALSLRFHPRSEGGRLILPDRNSLAPIAGDVDSVRHAQPTEERLTDTDLAHAKDLAQWFWLRRCAQASGNR